MYSLTKPLFSPKGYIYLLPIRNSELGLFERLKILLEMNYYLI